MTDSALSASRFRHPEQRARPHIVLERGEWRVIQGSVQAIEWGAISRQLGHDEQAQRWCRDANAA